MKQNNNKYSAPISEEGNEDVDEAEVDDVHESRISNINSMDPVQWSNVKRDIVDSNKRQEAIRKKLIYSGQESQ